MSKKKRNAFRIEAGVSDWGAPEWDLVDDRGGRWATFSNRTAATACLRGFRAIGFVPRPDEPSDEPSPTCPACQIEAGGFSVGPFHICWRNA